MDVEKKLSVLEKVARAFNQSNILWAVGASLLLYFKGIVDDFQDIDIMVAESDVETAQTILAGLGTRQLGSANKNYKTKVFIEFIVDGVELDIIAGFAIVKKDGEHYFPLEASGIAETILLHDTRIPLQSLESWRTYYTLMGRIEKAKLVENKLAEYRNNT